MHILLCCGIIIMISIGSLAVDWLERLSEIVGEQMVYLLVEESSEDYYITDKKFNRLISENHYDVVMLFGNGLDEQKIS